MAASPRGVALAKNTTQVSTIVTEKPTTAQCLAAPIQAEKMPCNGPENTVTTVLIAKTAPACCALSPIPSVINGKPHIIKNTS